MTGVVANAGPASELGSTAAQPAPAKERRLEVEGLTQSLMAQNRLYHSAYKGTQSDSAMLAEMVAVAAHREQTLTELVADDPGEVFRVALPDRVREKLPVDVQDYVEKRREREGTLQVLYEDYEHEARLRHFIKTDGARIPLHFKANPPKLLSGARVRVDGIEVGGVMAVESGDANLVTLELGGSGSTSSASSTSPTPLSNTLGEQRTLVLLVNFEDDPVEPWTVDDADALIFGSVSNFFVENSYGATWLSGDVYGWFTLPLSSTVCQPGPAADAADQAATDAGVDVAAYDRIVYLFTTYGCHHGGQGTIGGQPSRAWINNQDDPGVVAHEMGHNFGLHHSSALDCGRMSLAADCDSLEYGDRLDTMGGLEGHFNAFQKERLGWVNFDAAPPITQVTSGGTYSIEAYETPGTSPRVLKLPRGVDPVTGDSTWFYVEYRQAIGFDTFLDDWSYRFYRGDVTNGVVVHLGSESDSPPHLLHMHPDTVYYDTFGSPDWFDPALPVGFSFFDAESGITLTADSADGSSAAVSVSLGPQSCVPVAPDISLSPSESQWVDPGTQVEFVVTVTNNDSAVCSTAGFDLSASIPSGWTADFVDPQLSLLPGASGETGLTVTSSATTADGFYDVVVSATHEAGAAYSTDAVATYVVNVPSNTPPTAVDDNATTVENTPVTIDVIANDSDPEGGPLTITQVSQGTGGAVTINADDSVTYSPENRFAGSDSFTYTVADGQGDSDSATVTVTVEAAGDQPPVAVADTATTAQARPVTINVLSNDVDPEGLALAVTSATNGRKGSVIVNGNGTVTYLPRAKAKGKDSFEYTVSDGSLSSRARVSVQILRTLAMARD